MAKTGWYCTNCGALYATPGSGFITCRQCGHSGLRSFRRLPKRVRCGAVGCTFEGWDDGGVNDDLADHRRRACLSVQKLHALIVRIENEAHDGGITDSTMRDVHIAATEIPHVE